MSTQQVTIALVRKQQQALLARIDQLGDRAHMPLASATPAYKAAMLSARQLIQLTSSNMLLMCVFTREHESLGQALAEHLGAMSDLVQQNLVAVEAMLNRAAQVLQQEQDNRHQPGLYRVEHSAPAYTRKGPYMVRAVSRNDARRVALAVASGRHESEVSFEHHAEQLADFPMGVLVQAE